MSSRWSHYGWAHRAWAIQHHSTTHHTHGVQKIQAVKEKEKKNRTGGSYIFEGTVNLNGWVIHFAPHPSAWAPAPSLPRLLWLDKRTSHNYSLFSFRFRNKTKNTVRLQNSIVSPDDVWLVWWWRWWWDFWEKRQKHGVARGEHLFLLRIAADWWHSVAFVPATPKYRIIIGGFFHSFFCRAVVDSLATIKWGLAWNEEKKKTKKTKIWSTFVLSSLGQVKVLHRTREWRFCLVGFGEWNGWWLTHGACCHSVAICYMLMTVSIIRGSL